MILERTEANCERVFGKEHPLTLSAMRELGRLYRNTGKYDEAGDLFRRSLGTSERVLGPEHPGTLDSFHLVAGSHYIPGDFRGAADLWRRSTAIIVSATGAARRAAAPLTPERKQAEPSLINCTSWDFSNRCPISRGKMESRIRR